ncbi:beta-ketoacyl synthase chain length factor [Methylomonas sp. YC3]
MDCMSLLGFGACAPDAEFRASLPFPAFDIDREAIPPLLRRRSSQAMQMAFSAATAACGHARRSPATLPSIFASVAGEIKTTDQLCSELVKADGVISPAAFHNSVQNTAAGYWSIAQQCTQPASAIAAGTDTFAMAMLEAWCQLACQGGELLLVCYDEIWPEYLASGKGSPAFACALVLAAGAVVGSSLQLGRPQPGEAIFPSAWTKSADSMPILGAIPLLEAASVKSGAQAIALTPNTAGWQVDLGSWK